MSSPGRHRNHTLEHYSLRYKEIYKSVKGRTKQITTPTTAQKLFFLSQFFNSVRRNSDLAHKFAQKMLMKMERKGIWQRHY